MKPFSRLGTGAVRVQTVMEFAPELIVCHSINAMEWTNPVVMLALSNPGRGERFCPGSGVIYGNL